MSVRVYATKHVTAILCETAKLERQRHRGLFKEGKRGNRVTMA